MTESAWVIEGAWSSVATPDYWCGSSAWSSDHTKALRFARRADAEQAASLMLDGLNVRVGEHVWQPAPAVAVCGVDCHPGDALCNNYCNLAPQKGAMAPLPPMPQEEAT